MTDKLLPRRRKAGSLAVLTAGLLVAAVIVLALAGPQASYYRLPWSSVIQTRPTVLAAASQRIQSAATTTEWWYHRLESNITFGGLLVSQKLVADELDVRDRVISHATARLHSTSRCEHLQLASYWSAPNAPQALLHYQCKDTPPTNANPALPLVQHDAVVTAWHDLSGEPVEMDVRMIDKQPLTVIVPASACDVQRLEEFARNLVFAARFIAKKQIQLNVGMLQCTTPAAAQKLAAQDASSLSVNLTELSGINTSVIFSESRFSRSAALNIAIQQAADDSILVVMDVDMRVNAPFFAHCRALVQAGKSVYLPVVFSRYNPQRIRADPRGGRRVENANRTFVLTADTGKWRTTGWGMISLHASDAKRISYNESFTRWGGEDVAYRDQIHSLGLHIYRLTEPNMVHEWHPKHCDHLRAVDVSRYRLCLEIKVGYEGTAWQLWWSSGLAQAEADRW